MNAEPLKRANVMATLLRVAAVIAAVQYAAHIVLFLRATPTHGADEVELVQRMKTQRWDFSGFNRGYWDFYFGYGLLVIVWGVIEIILLWQLAALSSRTSVVPLVATLLLANVAHAILALRYFFLAPALFDTIVAIVLVLALVRA